MTKARQHKPAPEAGGYDLDRQIGFILRRAYQRHMAIFAETIGEDITATQFSTLFRLVEANGSMSQNALGRSVAMDAATTKGVVLRLVTRGLVSMRKDAVDRRRYMLEVTDERRALVERAIPRMREVTRKTLSPLSAEDARTLVQLLTTVA